MHFIIFDTATVHCVSDENKYFGVMIKPYLKRWSKIYDMVRWQKREFFFKFCISLDAMEYVIYNYLWIYMDS